MSENETDDIRSCTKEEDEKQYPPLKVVIPAMLAIYLSIFLVALDRTIIGTAVPTITKYFNSFGDVAWYESGFLLPLCLLQLTFGRVYRYYSTKWVLVSLVAIFEIGSIVCASTPTSNGLIVGRVLAGIGAAGITSGAFLLISILVPLQSRPQWTGGIGGVFGIASILGPVLGGYLASITWRWCFWINVPVGGVALALLVLLTPRTAPQITPAPTWYGKIEQLDPVGFVLIGPATICLLFAVQWGGVTYAWSNARIIALFALAGVLFLVFIASQSYRQENATVPPRIFWKRSILAGCVAQIGTGSTLVLFAFYLPIWFQIVQDKPPQSSGLSLLPLLLSNVLAVISGGIITSRVGYYTPLMIAGGAVIIVGAALVTTWQVDVSSGKWIGYQILVGAGLGLTLQGPNIAAQTVLSDRDAPIGLSLLNFCSLFAGTVFVSVSQTLLDNGLIRGLDGIIPGFDPATLTNGGATTLRNSVPADELSTVLVVYNDSMRSIWYLALGLCCLILLGSLGMEWKSVKKGNGKGMDEMEMRVEKA